MLMFIIGGHFLLVFHFIKGKVMNKKGAANNTSAKTANHFHGSVKESLSTKEVLDLLKLIGWTRDIIRKARQKELAPYRLNPDETACYR
jgi:hypothetical protein